MNNCNFENMSVGEIIDVALDEVEREILELYCCHGYSVRGVAAEMRMSSNEVRRTINDALVNLRPIILRVSEEIPEDSDDILDEEEHIIVEAFREEMETRGVCMHSFAGEGDQ